MDKGASIEQVSALLAQLQEPEQSPEVRSVKVGDLEWQADVPDKRFTWAEAQAYAASLGDGWRLPTIQELLTLVDYTRHKPACSVFPDCPSKLFWSSSAYSGNTAVAWLVDFSDGHSYSFDVGYCYRVRCVR